MSKPLILGLFFAACAALHVYAKRSHPDLEHAVSGAPAALPAPNDLDDPEDGNE